MKKEKRQLKILAKNSKLDPDELLLLLWEKNEKYKYLKNENSVVKGKDLYDTKKIIRLYLSEEKKPIYKKSPSISFKCKSYDFGNVGKINDNLQYLSEDEVATIYDELVLDFSANDDPINPVGIKDHALLLMAIQHPHTSYDNIKKYPTIETAAAALMYALTHNHAFYNGNKRTSIVSMLTILDRHNLMILCDQDELFKISLDLAKHKLVKSKFHCPDDEIYVLATWIHNNTRTISKAERSITLRRLKQILNEYDCEILESGKVRRSVLRKNFLGIEKKISICSNSSISSAISDGKEVDKYLIKSLRYELNLVEEHGVDSDAFYGKDYYYSTSDFINKYKNLLRRLSRV